MHDAVDAAKQHWIEVYDPSIVAPSAPSRPFFTWTPGSCLVVSTPGGGRILDIEVDSIQSGTGTLWSSKWRRWGTWGTAVLAAITLVIGGCGLFLSDPKTPVTARSTVEHLIGLVDPASPWGGHEGFKTVVQKFLRQVMLEAQVASDVLAKLQYAEKDRPIVFYSARAAFILQLDRYLADIGTIVKPLR